MRIKFLAVGVLGTIPSAGMVIPAFAQDEAAVRRAGIDEIVVTAQRREASLQDTDIAISAFTEGALSTPG